MITTEEDSTYLQYDLNQLSTQLGIEVHGNYGLM